MKGASEIACLKLEVLQKLISKMTASPNCKLSAMFGNQNADSDTIKWESQIGSRGMAPFVAPGAVAPQTAPNGVSQHQATAAFFKEKMYLDEEFLNNLRQPGTEAMLMTKQAQLAKNLKMLVDRSNRRKEWMMAKMIADGGFTYLAKGGLKLAVDYSVPATHKVAKTGTAKWNAGTAADIMGDINDAKLLIEEDCQATDFVGITTTNVFKHMVNDATIRALLRKDSYGEGKLYGKSAATVVNARPEVLADLLDLPIVICDEKYAVRAVLTGAVTGGSTVAIPVEDVTDFEVAGSLKFVNTATGLTEIETIASIEVEAGTVTVAAAPDATFVAGRDYVEMIKTFVPNNKFIVLAKNADGGEIAEYMNAPFGLGRSYGMAVDQKEEWDPEGMNIRVQAKGLPVLYQTDALYQMTVLV